MQLHQRIAGALPVGAYNAMVRRSPSAAHPLDGQETLGSVWGQIRVKGVDEYGQHAVIAEDQAQLHDPLAAKLLQS